MIGGMVLDLVQARLGAIRHRTVGEHSVDEDDAEARVRGVVANMWAKTTVQNRQSLWSRMLRWMDQVDRTLSADTAVLFVAATGVKPQGQLSYTKTLSGTFRHLGLPNQPLLSYASALRAVGAAVPIHQADPIPRETLLAWAYLQPPTLKLACLLAWKTASRWGDVIALTSSQVLECSGSEVILDWGRSTKGRRQDPFTAAKFVVIRGPHTDVIASLLGALRPFTRITDVSTAGLDALWGASAVMCGYTAHSIKRGAISHLLGLMSSGVEIPPALLARLGKHETQSDWSRLTIRYGGNRVALARALRTGDVTVHL